MTRVTLVGAGGNMGGRVRRSLRGDDAYELRLVEASSAARALLEEEGWEVSNSSEAYAGAEIVILAVPDTLVGDIAADVVPRMDPGATLMCLDPAGPYAERLPRREDISCVVTHPTHPPQFDLLEEESPEARRDYWGGGRARQSIVNALAWGEEAAYAPAEALGKRIFQPILRSHRVTLEQLATLEPAMSEAIGMTCCAILREATDEVVARGVPEQAARDFMLGHVQLGLAILYDMLDWKLSAGAQQVVDESMQLLLKPDWKRVFDREEVRRSVDRITTGAAPASTATV